MRPLEFSTFGAELSKLELHSTGDGRTMVGYASAFDFPIPGDNGETLYIKPGAFTKTLKEQRDQIQVLFHHGMDPQIGPKPLGTPKVMEQDRTGLWTETPLARTSYNDEIVIPLLESGALRSMSIQFAVMQRSWNDERTEVYYEQLMLAEYGPTPFPRNLGASAALHSLVLPGELELHWDGNAAMRTCSSAADFRQIAFERNNEADPDTAAHWTLPHHPRPGAGPDSQGVSAALAALSGARGGAPDLKLAVETVRSHLENHQAEASAEGRETTLNADRLTWTIKTSRSIEAFEADLERQAARLRTLRG